MKYKTSEDIRLKAKAKRDAIKAAGGAAYAELLEKERGGRRKYRERNPQYWKAAARKTMLFKTWLCSNARARGRKKGLEATIMPADLEWPAHCPILGIELDYPARSGTRKDQHAKANWPSLDRRDPKIGYVPGNVFVMSFRANTLKSNANLSEILRLAEYLTSGCVAGSGVGPNC